MKAIPFQARFRIGIIQAIFLLLFPFFSNAQTFVGVSSIPGDNGTQAGPTVTITPPGGVAAGDLVVIYAHYRGAGATLSLANAGGQSWTNETTDNGGNQTFAIFWCRFNGAWTAPDPSITVGAGNALTAAMYVYRPSSSANSWAIHVPATNSSANTAAVSIAGLTTTVPNTVTMAFWGSENDNTWGTLTGAGWLKTGLAAQYRNLSGTDQSHSAAYNIRTTAGAVANVSQTQSVATPTRTSIISWMEIATPSNDLCANAVTLTSNPSCSNTSGTLTNSTFNSIATLGCGASNVNDVWYTFTAKTTNPTISLSSYPANSTIQLFSGTCASPTPIASGCSSTGTLTTSGLTIGTTYRIRVYSSTNATGTFNICVTDPPPANDECNGAISLTAGTTCSNTITNVYAASTSSTPIAPCVGTMTYDLWYYFVAPAANATISLSSIGSAIGATSLNTQLFSGDCGGLVSVTCGTTVLAATGLTPGNYYYVRVFSTGAAPTSTTNANFSICVTFTALLTAPSNDICANAITLPVNTTCVKTQGTMVNATSSSAAVAPICNNATYVDVWYQFVATSTSTTVSVGDFGANFTSRRLQVLSGSCGSFTQLYCNTGMSTTVTTAVGTTYYVRVISSSATPPTSFGDFSICVYNTATAQRFGNSYVNITKKTTGGVVEPGDILEIRMTINHTSGTIQNMRYVDNVPTNTAMLTGATDRISVITNEGVAIQNYTPAAGDDAATYLAAPPAGQFQIRMNLGFGTTTTPSPASGIPANNSATESASATGQLNASTHIPKGGGGVLFATAYRVVVTGNVGDVITLGAGRFIYKTTSGGPDITLTGTPYQILISSPMNLCANSAGVNMSEEFGGTFGSGPTLNRGSDLASPIAGYSFVDASAIQAVGDGQYAIVKNMSPRSGTNRNAERNPVTTTPLPSQNSSSYRMYGHWDIDGDHTGTSNSVGNAPLSDGVNGGYMLMVNADFVASETYRQTLTNLCPNTYYEFSAWFRNICPTCGIDYVTGSNYSPRQPGVLPNLTFTLDGLDRYSTGEIPYYSSGTTEAGWVKKGFVFITGPTQTSATFTIRNNSQGGGGNDWVMDDIAIATCLPNMNYTPSTAPAVCMTNPLVVDNTITSYFNNYTHYKWQRRASGSPTWTDLAGQTGSTTPTLVSGQWQYMISYTIPPAFTTLANNGDQYRVIVATSNTNLSDGSCQVTDGVSQITLTVNNCAPVLGTNIISFNANVEAGNAVLKWTTDKEKEQFRFIIERSTDGVKYAQVAAVSSNNDFDNSINTYNWSEPYAQGKYYYRVKMISNLNGEKYSKVASIGNMAKIIESASTLNPFSTELVTNLQVARATNAILQLVDNSGRVVRTQNYILHTGQNRLTMDNVKPLSQGFYTIRITVDQTTITKKLLKQ